jgi:hypothetical protein
MLRGMGTPIVMQEDLEGTLDVNAAVSAPENGRTSASLLEMASVDWSQHRVISREHRKAFEESWSS